MFAFGIQSFSLFWPLRPWFLKSISTHEKIVREDKRWRDFVTDEDGVVEYGIKAT